MPTYDFMVENVTFIGLILRPFQQYKYYSLDEIVGEGGFMLQNKILSSYLVSGCLISCTEKRSKEWRWNGVHYLPFDGCCYCVRNDIGHDPSINQDFMHFKG